VATQFDEALGFEAFQDAAEEGKAGQGDSAGPPRELFRMVFGSTEGREVMAYLFRQFVHGQRWQPGEPMEFGVMRDGQAAVVSQMSNWAYGPLPEDD